MAGKGCGEILGFSHRDSSDGEQGWLFPVSWEKAAGNFLECKRCSSRIPSFPAGSSKAVFVLSHSTATGRFPRITIRGENRRPKSPFFIPGKPGRREESNPWMMELLQNRHSKSLSVLLDVAAQKNPMNVLETRKIPPKAWPSVSLAPDISMRSLLEFLPRLDHS